MTITVRDQRMRQHDPILGIVPLKLSDILQTSSQVTRWYPLDGGIGFGRIRISLLFRSIETRLPPTQLGWDVGTFEFMGERLVASKYTSYAKLKMRTGGSSGKIPKTQCRKLEGNDGVFWDIAKKDGKNNVRLPVKYRYRAPVIFEFHAAGKRSAGAYAVLWLCKLEDNKESDFDIPIWKTDNSMRLTQNYITEENFHDIPDMNIEEIGRLQFRGRFKAGIDEDHDKFVVDNDTREVQETWEACHSEGVRDRVVSKEIPETVQKLHDESLTQGRDVLDQADEGEKQKWLSKDGTDWSGAFGQDPAEIAEKSRGNEANLNERMSVNTGSGDTQSNPSDSDSDSDDSDLGVHDASNHQEEEGTQDGEKGSGHSGNLVGQIKNYNDKKKGLHRKHRGLMQWKPMRNLAFAKDEAKYAARRALKIGSLNGRQPDVETETG